MRIFWYVFGMAAMLLPQCLTAQILGQQSLSSSSYIVGSDGNLYAWGANHDGQLGVGSTTDQNIPVMVALPLPVSRWTLVAGGLRHAIALGDSDRLYAFGYNGDGELGNNTTTSRQTPSPVQNPSGVIAWLAISAGVDHTLALASNGALYAWGGNAHGQLGNGKTTNSLTPSLVPFPAGVTHWTQISAGPYFSLATGDDGNFYGWGIDSGAIIGTGNLVNSTPIRLGPPPPLFSPRIYSPLPIMSAGGGVYPAAVIQRSGAALPYRENNVAAVAQGASHSLRLYNDGSMTSQGSNTYGQLGTGNHIDKSTPVTFPMPTGVTQWLAISAGTTHSLALGNNGKLYAWGDNRFGQLGDGTSVNQTSPVAVRSFGPALSMTVTVTSPSTLSGKGTIEVDMSASTSAILYSPSAYLVLNSGINLVNSSALQVLSQQSISAGTPGIARWDIAVDSVFAQNGGIVTGFILSAATNTASVLSEISINVPATKPVLPFKIVIRDSATNQGIPFATLQWRDPFAIQYFTADSIGEIALNPSYSGTVGLMAGAENYRSGSTFAQVIPGQSQNIEFKLDAAPICGSFTSAGVKPSDSFDAMDFVSSTQGFALVQHNQIFETTDAGLTWHGKSNLLHNCTTLSCLNAQFMWCVGPGGLIMQSSDGGRAWRIQPSGTTQDLRSIVILKDTLGFAVGDDGAICALSSKGWRVIDSLAGEDWAVVSAPNSKRFLAISDDGTATQYSGGSFANSPFGIVSPASVVFVSPQDWFAAGAQGLYSSVAPTLDPLPFPVADRPVGMTFLDRTIGFIACDSGHTLVTYNGGVQSVPIKVPALSFNHIASFGNSVFLSAGSNGFYSMKGAPAPGKVILTGRISHETNDLPVVGACVLLTNGSTTLDSSFTNLHGGYLMADVLPGTAKLSVRFASMDSLATVALPTFSANANTVYVKDYVVQNTSGIVAQTIHGEEVSVSISPNPATSMIQIHLTTDNSWVNNIYLVDALGRTVRSIHQGISISGIGEQNMSVDGLTGGVYYLIVDVPGHYTKPTKVVVTR